jgi:hypothetical protein
MKRIIFAVIACVAASAVCSLASCVSAPGRTLTGVVRIYGSEPHTWAGINSEPDDKIYLIEGRAAETELRAMQGKRMVFTVRIKAPESAYPIVDGVAELISYRVAGNGE